MIWIEKQGMKIYSSSLFINIQKKRKKKKEKRKKKEKNIEHILP